MLKKKVLICDDCFHYLAKKSTAIASFWSYLCTLYTNKITPKNTTSQHDPRFTFLEQEGFIMTTEFGKSTLGIMLLGHDPESQIICLNKHVSDINL